MYEHLSLNEGKKEIISSLTLDDTILLYCSLVSMYNLMYGALKMPIFVSLPNYRRTWRKYSEHRKAFGNNLYKWANILTYKTFQ